MGENDDLLPLFGQEITITNHICPFRMHGTGTAYLPTNWCYEIEKWFMYVLELIHLWSLRLQNHPNRVGLMVSIPTQNRIVGEIHWRESQFINSYFVHPQRWLRGQIQRCGKDLKSVTERRHSQTQLLFAFDTHISIRCAYTSTFKRGAIWFRYRVKIHHPWGFNWHPFEGAGRCVFFISIICHNSEMLRVFWIAYWQKVAWLFSTSLVIQCVNSTWVHMICVSWNM